jgi:hypothetical protein
MRRWIWATAVTAGLLGAQLVRQEPARGDAFGLKGKFEVSRAELAYSTEGKGARLQLLLAAGEAVEHEVKDAETLARVVDFLAIKAAGGRLGVELQSGEVRAFYVVAGGPFAAGGR